MIATTTYLMLLVEYFSQWSLNKLNDEDVVKHVLNDHLVLWNGLAFDEVLDYYLNPSTDRAPFQAQAAKVSMNVLVFQDWKRHLDNALEVVKTWKPE